MTTFRSAPMAAALALGAAVLLLPAFAHANCTPDPNAIMNYTGTIDKYKIGMSLKFAGTSVQGDYFYVSQRKNIAVRGTVGNGKEDRQRGIDRTIVLEELDQNGQPVARFELEGLTGCPEMQGSWRKRGSGKTLGVSLTMEADTSGDLAHRYRGAGAASDDVVNQAAYAFWLAVKEGKKQAVAQAMHYPVEANIKGRRTALPDSAALLANYDTIFTRAYRQAILESVPHNMFSKGPDIMLGHGHAWFNAKGQVVTLNN